MPSAAGKLNHALVQQGCTFAALWCAGQPGSWGRVPVSRFSQAFMRRPARQRDPAALAAALDHSLQATASGRR